ncbi:MAG: hypothetical protein ABJO27_11340 [Pseudoruegeria sp.]
MKKPLELILLCLVLSGCNFISESTIRSQIPDGFEIAKLRYFKSQIDCVLAVYDTESFDIEGIEGGDFSFVNNENESEIDQNFIGITLLAGKTCADSNIRDDFMEFHNREDIILLVNTAQNATITFPPLTQTLYFLGRD